MDDELQHTRSVHDQHPPPGHGGVFVLPNACEQLMLAILAGGVNISATQTHMKRQLNELMEGVLLFDVSIG